MRDAHLAHPENHRKTRDDRRYSHLFHEFRPSDVTPVFEAIAASANRLIGGFSATVMLFVDDALHLVAFTQTNAAADRALQASFPRPLAEFPHFEFVRGGETVQFPDTEAENVPPVNRELARLRGYRSMVFTPLMSKGAPVGILSVTRVRLGTFPTHHVQLLRTFADQAVIAIENTRLFEEVQARTRELSQSLDDLRTMQDRLIQTEKLASLGQLTAGIAHEIKNPLNFINNFSSLSAELIDELDETLATAPLDQEMRSGVDELTQMLKSNLEKVVQHGKRADSIVKNMLQHSREGSGERRSADINALVSESLNLAYCGARAEKPGFAITLKHELDPDAGSLELSRRRLPGRCSILSPTGSTRRSGVRPRPMTKPSSPYSVLPPEILGKQSKSGFATMALASRPASERKCSTPSSLPSRLEKERGSASR